MGCKALAALVDLTFFTLMATLFYLSGHHVVVLALAAPMHAKDDDVSSHVKVCRSSRYPELCRSVISPLKYSSNNSCELGRFSVDEALKQAQQTTSLLLSSNAAEQRGQELDDCLQLADLNLDHLQTVQSELNHIPDIERVKALMSALVTNQQTCFDALQESSTAFPEILYGAVSNQTQLYVVSLELVTSALETKHPKSNPGLDGFTSPHSAFSSMEHLLIDGNNSLVPSTHSVIVAKDGTGNFTTISDAVAFAPNGTSIDNGYFTIFIRGGVYDENILIPKNKKNLCLFGSGVDRTIITGNRSTTDKWSTFHTSTFAVNGERFVATNITFQNTAGPENHQAVAVRNSADLSTFYRCRFIGYQDTLYVHSLRQFYRDCDIYGTVDFIFGNAATVFQNCNIYARKPLPNQFNTITAQGRTIERQTTGISIHNCTIRAAPDLEPVVNSTKTFLGRPWREYSRVVYMQSFIDNVIEPTGWSEWNRSFAVDTLYYGEYDNYGPGANTSSRVQWPGYNLMSQTDAFNFTVYNFTTGGVWLPSTSIPYCGGLL